ncbi:acyl-CoA-binding protein [Hesseltinella vesiculosa]|uniref:Acyl-CoA-binding protein n=1 Tax=Hesseltinella vesiculosa TaxID=101127 RepID=A0A1X2GD55_9FUNG|nr:acyl-CoA-binding protein [Hesseltinella vesiculosa]
MPSPAFEDAAKQAKNFQTLPEDEELLKLYGLFKQATLGDNQTDKPVLDMRARYKWMAWDENRGMPQVEAEIQYISYVQELASMYQ